MSEKELTLYHTAFRYIEEQKFREAAAVFAELLACSPSDETAREFHTLLEQAAENFPYAVHIEEPVVVFYRQEEVEPGRLRQFLDRSRETLNFLQQFPGLTPIPLFVLVIHGTITTSHADYKNRPWVPKIRLNPFVQLGTVAHEIAHLSFINANRFLAEGFAMHVESSHAFAREDKRYFFHDNLSDMYFELIPLATLLLEDEEHLHYFADACDSPYHRVLAYHEAGSFVHYLIRQFSWETFLQLAQQLHVSSAPEQIEQAFAARLHRSLALIEEDWKKDTFPNASQVRGETLSVETILGHLQKPAEKKMLGRPVTLEQMEAVLADLEVSLGWSALCAFEQELQELQHEDSLAVELNSTEPHARFFVSYYLGRTCLSLLNALELEVDWLYEDNTQMSKTMPGFAMVRQAGVGLLEKGIGILQKLLAHEDAPKFRYRADVHRILGELYGRMIKYKGKFASISYGPQAEKSLGDAHKLDNKNVRTLTALGRLKLFTPKIFGGGSEPAKKYFTEALGLNPLFQESHIGLALCACVEGNMTTFAEQLHKALEIHHGDRCAQKLLTKFKKGETIIK